MHKNIAPRKQILALTIASLFASSGAWAQSAPPASDNAGTVVVTGTRVPNRTALDTTSPVDIISADTIKNSGSTELNQALSIALPSLNFPRPGLADGTDTVRPATLRGMGPDQTLVLVNSKRRHASSLVNVNGTVGRGSASVDMNTIPTAIIKNIEVLRDGAAAQYGSDAISGVVNLRLKTNSSGGEGTITYGKRDTEYDFFPAAAPAGATWTAPSSPRKTKDGETITASVWKGLPLGESGFLTIALEHKEQKKTIRTGYDMRQQYPTLAGGAYDPRELTINRFNAWYGEPELDQTTLFANAGMNLDGGVKLYGWSSYQQRDALSAGNFRRALQDQNVISIYPNGFLPLIAPRVEDFSVAGGGTWTMGEWDMDASIVVGKNKMRYGVENTLNRSIGPASKTTFDAGGYAYQQAVFNLTAVKPFKMAGMESPLNVAVGTEARRENYRIFAGEPDSYRYGGVLLANGTPSAPGAQVFPGFRPSDEIDTGRTAISAFVDVEANITSQWLASGALRAERYSDFGSSLAGKFATRFDFTKEFALRGAIQNGFRAPSPQQQFFSTTSTNFIGGIPFDITTFRPDAAPAVALGAKPLDAEKSVNISLGAVARVGAVNITVDAYQINIKDRIVLSENLNSTAVQNYLKGLGFIGIGGARFFLNGAETETRGVDMVGSWGMNAGDAGKFDFTLAANVTKTEVTKVPATAQVTALSPSPVLFGRVVKLVLEKGQPKNKLNASVNWKLGAWGASVRATRYGEVLSPDANPALDFVLSPKTVIDIEGRYAITKELNVALGADNVFDKYPEALPPTLNPNGGANFSNYAPFGRGGRFLYARVSYAF